MSKENNCLDFKTQYSSHGRYHTDNGTRMKKMYQSFYDDSGNLELKEIGEENRYDYIQSFKDSVDINVILSRFARGDVDALTQRQGAYGDFTIMPKTYADMLNLVASGEEAFMKLPVEERAKFNHNFAEWLFNFDKIASEQEQNVPEAGIDIRAKEVVAE